MTQEEVIIIHQWAHKAFKYDWVNQKSWYFRLSHWWHWNIYGINIGWYDESELASSIISHTQNQNGSSI